MRPSVIRFPPDAAALRAPARGFERGQRVEGMRRAVRLERAAGVERIGKAHRIFDFGFQILDFGLIWNLELIQFS